MLLILQKIPFLIELFFNGIFILIYSLKRTGKIPSTWNMEFINKYLSMTAWIIPIVLFLVVLVNYLSSERLEEFFRKHIFSLIVFFPLWLTWGDVEFAYWLSSVHLLSSVLALYDTETEADPEKSKIKTSLIMEKNLNILERIQKKPAQIVLLSFFMIIFAGTFVLMLPPFAAEGKSISFVDAFFTATSATCVTGLSTLSLSQDLSILGQLVVLVLIQIGGLGFMILYSFMIISMGRSMDMTQRVIMQDLLSVNSLEDLREVIFDIIKYTIAIELWGGIVLSIAFIFEDFEFGQALYYGFFHSISAFCNAGFSLFDNSLESFATTPMINMTIAALIIMGGLGFIVMRELKQAILFRQGFVRFGLHTKVVLVTSAILTILGMLVIFFGEFLNALDGYTLWEKIQISFFQSVTLRTAGFNTIPLNGFNTYILYIMTLFMYVGASPGSTGGGLKTTTLAILLESIRSTLKGGDKVEMFDRSIPQTMVVRSTALTILLIFIGSIFIFIMMKLESNQEFLSIFFEIASASGTVGLTLGITPFLSMGGKLAMCLLMFIGRVGPITMLLAIGQESKSRGTMEYPDGRIMIG